MEMDNDIVKLMRANLEVRDHEGIEGLLKEYPQLAIDTLDRGGNTALHVAVEKRDEWTVDLLLRHGATLSATNRDGNTPLQLAAGSNHPGIFESLLKHALTHERIDISAIQEGTYPLLWLAVQKNLKKNVKLLLEIPAELKCPGVDVNQLVDGMTAYAMAKAHSNLPIMRMLEAKGGEIIVDYSNYSSDLPHSFFIKGYKLPPSLN